MQPPNTNPQRERDHFKDHEERLAVLSTTHITRADATLLERAAARTDPSAPLRTYPHAEYGWLIPTNQDALDPNSLERAGFSPDMRRLLVDARDAGYAWLLLDRDADQHPNYPSHNW